MDLNVFLTETLFRAGYLGILVVVVAIYSITRALRSKDNSKTVFLIGLLTFFVVVFDLLSYYSGFYFRDGILAAQWKLIFEIFVSFYIPLIPAYLGSVAKIGKTESLINKILVFVAVIWAVAITVFAMVYPDSLVGQSPPWNPTKQWNVGFGNYGLLSMIRDFSILLVIGYFLVSIILGIVLKKAFKRNMILLLGISVSIFFAVDSLVANFTGHYLLMTPGVNFPRFLTGLLFFFLVGIGLDSYKFITEALKADSTLKELQISQEKLVMLAYYDQLTGLPNRKNFFEKIEFFCLENDRSPRGMGLLFIDFDLFRIVNESLGHLGGDKLLMEAVMRIKESLRSSDYLFRLGGDELTLILTSLNSPADAGLVAQKLLTLMEAPFTIDSVEIHLTMSIGISVLPRDGRTAMALFRKADEALTDAKRDRNTFRFYTSALNIEAVKKIGIINGLRHALSQDSFELFFQPQMDKGERVAGVEALLRFKGVHSNVSPGVFIPIAENSGLIQSVGNWVIRQAFQACAKLRQAGFDIPIAINISTKQLRDVQFFGTLEAAYKESGLAYRDIHLEITETAFLEQDQAIEMVLRKLFNNSIPLVIDDFGTGFSNLSYIRDMPISSIKIDKSFIDPVPDSARTSKLVQSIIGLAKSLDMTVIAEGVEIKKQLDFLKESHIDQVQGFYYARPMTWDKLQEFLNERKVLA